MKLHLDKEAFEYIIDELSKANSVRRDVLEKDYYVTLLLNELSRLPNQGYAYFKGDTALYKALRSIRRFSEDIDLTVYVEDCPSTSQEQKRLEKVSKKYTSMPKGRTIEDKRGSITCEYVYDSMYNIDTLDKLQRFGSVKVEATSFTVSEPTDKIEIAPHLYELCSEERKEILSKQYDVKPFFIETISLERIFIDKVFAAEFYYERKEYSDVAKHVYDLTVLMSNEKIIEFLKDKERVNSIVALKRKEELNRLGGVDSKKDVANFEYFLGLTDNKSFDEKFAEMQKIYVLNKNDIIAKEEMLSALAILRDVMDSQW